MNLNGGYAMIKHNSTQEELQIAYRSKRPALFYDENQRAHWAVIEETATQSVDEETQEPITLYEYSYRLLNDIEALVDSQGNNRFINNYGIWKSVPGMQGIKATWSLNGYNLMFEALGSFNTDIRINSNFTIVSFKLPNWILNKINTPVGNVIDMITFKIVDTTGSYTDVPLFVNKTTNDKIDFMVINSITPTDTTIFRIRYNLIIDNE